MTYDLNYELNKAPHWLYEAAILLSELDTDRTKILIKNHSSFGLSEEEMTESLEKFSSYRNAVLPQVLPIYEEYPYLHNYFKGVPFTTEGEISAAPTLAARLGNERNKIPDRDRIDNLVNKFIADLISEYNEDIDSDEIRIDSLENLLKYLDSIDSENFADETKLILIDLYYNRYKVIEGLVDILNRCALICEEFFHIIEDDFHTALENVNDRDNIKKLLDKDSSLKLNFNEGINSFVSVLNFNGLHVTVGLDGFVMYVGIYFFDYLKLKTENRFNDTQLINDLKALGDATRLKIVHLLAEEKMYVQELANELELTPATISHHINVLLKSELISITLDTEKPKTIYYELNNGKIDSLGNTIKGLANIEEV